MALKKSSPQSSIHSQDKLYSAFQDDPAQGIQMSKQYLFQPNFNSFEDFMDDVKKTQRSSACIVSWDNSMLTARCLDCQLADNSCICIPCFLAGRHDTHHSYIVAGSGCGNCDCGDPNFWKPSGNCPNHPGPNENPDQTQMTPQIRQKFLDVFQAALSAGLNSSSDQDGAVIFEFVESFVKVGDGLRRCVAISLSKIETNLFYEKLQEMGEVKIQGFLSLLGSLISDNYFSTRIGSAFFQKYLELRNIVKAELLKDSYDKNATPLLPLGKFLDFSFHFFNKGPLYYAIHHTNFDWVSFSLRSLRFVFETLEQLNDFDDFYQRTNVGSITHHIWYIQKFIEAIIKDDDMHDSIQQFINEFSGILFEYEASIAFLFPVYPMNDSTDQIPFCFLSINLNNLTNFLTNKNELSPKNKVFDLNVVFNNLCNFINYRKQEKSFYDGAYSPNVKHSLLLPLHHLFYSLLINTPNPADTLRELCQNNKVDLGQFCQDAIIYPLRIIVVFRATNNFNLLNQAYKYFLEHGQLHPERLYQQMLGFVQLLFALSPRQDQMISSLVILFGCIKPPLESFQAGEIMTSQERCYQTHHMDLLDPIIETAYLDVAAFCCSLITDRIILSNNSVLIKRVRVMELLKIKQASAKDIESFVDDVLSNPIFGDDVQSFTERVINSSGSYFKLTNDYDFSVFFPLIIPHNRMQLLIKNPDKFIPIPDDVPMHFGLSFKDFIQTPEYISLMYMCLASDVINATQIGLAMFVLLMRSGINFSDDSYREPNVTFEYSNIEELIAGFHQVLNSSNKNFLTAKVIKQTKAESIISLIQKKKQLGLEAMNKTQIPEFLKPKEQLEETERIKKAKSQALKQQIMKEFQDKRNQFSQTRQTTQEESAREKVQEPLAPLCNICQGNDMSSPIGYPCLALPCMFPEIINNQLHNLGIPLEKMKPTQSLSICLHQIHYQCFQELHEERTRISQPILCPIDRGHRNCCLPSFPLLPTSQDDFTQPPESMMVSILDFMNMAFDLSPESALRSYAGLILTFEVRHRSRPDCLDSPTVPILIRNVLLTIYHSGLCRDLSLDEKSDPLLLLISSIVKSSNPGGAFSSFVKQISKDLNDDYLYEFLRRAALIEEFAIKRVNSEIVDNPQKSSLIDWDENLSFNNLLERYQLEIPCKQIELPPFTTIPLADRFVQLYQPPYNLNIFDNYIVRFIDLLTGKLVIFTRNEASVSPKDRGDLPFLSEYASQTCHNGPVMLLSLTGPNASDIIYACPTINMLVNQPGFYVDQFGDTDQGFKRGTILSLSKDKLENALDKLLSGDEMLYH